MHAHVHFIHTHTHTYSDSTQLFSKRGITLLSLLTSTVPFALIWAATNYMYTRALTLIEPSDVTALFSSAPAFVFILSLIILREPPLVFRVTSLPPPSPSPFSLPLSPPSPSPSPSLSPSPSPSLSLSPSPSPSPMIYSFWYE